MHGSIEARDATDIPVVANDMTRDGAVASACDAQNAALSFFCPDVTDASTLKRVQQFMDFGYSVTVFGFRRERYDTDYQPPWPNEDRDAEAEIHELLDALQRAGIGHVGTEECERGVLRVACRRGVAIPCHVASDDRDFGRISDFD